MKKWPDLVATLQAKAPLLETEEEQVALHLQIANLYTERFSNQAAAIKAFEKVLELDPENEDAIRHLVAVYEKRRDWEKLIELREQEIENASPGERAVKTYEVAKIAASRVKKPDICTHWWEKVLELEPEHEEAISELEKLYERGENWEGPKAQTDALQKLGLLYTDKIVDPD